MPWDISDAVEKDARLATALVDLTEPLRKAVEVAAAAIDKNFVDEASAGEAWEPLAPRTLQDRARLGFPPGPILQRTGDLRKDATAHRVVTSDEAEVGPDAVEYAKYHVNAPRSGKLPRRDFLLVSDRTEDEIDGLIAGHLDAALGGG